MNNQVNQIKEACMKALSQASTNQELEQIRVNTLGKKGSLTQLMPLIKDLNETDKKAFGQLINQTKKELETAFLNQEKVLNQQALNQQFENEKIDVTAPGYQLKTGSVHPIMLVTQTIEDYFIALGFKVASGPEVELDYYNFEMMNMAKDHPARAMHDSFYLTESLLLRTHTSPVQARFMQAHKGEDIAIIAPGKTYRRDADDATHSHQFFQIEGLVVGQNISFGTFKGVLLGMVQHLFGQDKSIRLRPSFFPFTEPSVEVDVEFVKKDGTVTYIELLGAGMVHPQVLSDNGFDPKVYSGFAFGMGAERVGMLKYQIDDIRHFYQNDVRFLNQFKGVLAK